jgi:hypothetical protein
LCCHERHGQHRDDVRGKSLRAKHSHPNPLAYELACLRQV